MDFYQSDRPVRNWLSRLDELQLKFIIGAGSNSNHPSLFWSYLPHLTSESYVVFFLDSLFFKKYSIKISYFFSTVSTSWELVESNYRASMYGALILVILEPKFYLVRAHKLHITPRNSLGLVLGHFVGFLQPTLSPFGFLVVKQRDKCGQLVNLVNRGMFVELGKSETD